MPRFFVEKISHPAVLSPEESRHALRALRLGPGDRVTVFDPKESWSGEIESIAGAVKIRLLERLAPPPPPPGAWGRAGRQGGAQGGGGRLDGREARGARRFGVHPGQVRPERRGARRREAQADGEDRARRREAV